MLKFLFSLITSLTLIFVSTSLIQPTYHTNCPKPSIIYTPSPTLPSPTLIITPSPTIKYPEPIAPTYPPTPTNIQTPNPSPTITSPSPTITIPSTTIVPKTTPTITNDKNETPLPQTTMNSTDINFITFGLGILFGWACCTWYSWIINKK